MHMDELTRRPVAGGRLRRFLTTMADRIDLWCSRYRERCALSRFDDHMLKDIGLTRIEAKREVNKPFWKP